MSWKGRVRLVQGDIAETDTEAVVNAANTELWMGSGVAGALKRVGGAAIEQEAVMLGPINVGEAVLTGGGNLKALHVIHAAAMSPERPASPAGVVAATQAALALAAEQRIGSLALPALGTGVGALGFRDCARAMLAAIEQHCDSQHQPAEIRIVLFGENALRVFEEALNEL
jgi:O-acetyl-ADP-ribose deacetylase (regulator of RNase III)